MSCVGNSDFRVFSLDFASGSVNNFARNILQSLTDGAPLGKKNKEGLLQGRTGTNRYRIGVLKMLQLPTNGQHIFEVSIYNKDVRTLVKENQSHKTYDDQWADNRIHDVVALEVVVHDTASVQRVHSVEHLALSFR